jgi:hypothetical protein
MPMTTSAIGDYAVTCVNLEDSGWNVLTLRMDYVTVLFILNCQLIIFQTDHSDALIIRKV